MRKQKALLMIILAGFTVSITGCETMGESAGLGAAIGAGLGAVVGGDGDRLEGAAIGAVLGAAAGAVVHDVRRVRAEKTRTAVETAEIYDYAPTQGESMVLEESRIEPAVARRGEMIDASIQYAILGTGSGSSVTETRIVKHGDDVIAQISSQRFVRNDGTWVSAQSFRIPDDWTRGDYTLEQVVESDQSRIFSASRFTVQ